MCVKLKAILAGFVVDLGGSTGVGIIIGMVVAAYGASQGITSRDALLDVSANVYVKAIGLVGTTLSTCLGGFVAARMSRPHGIKNAVAVGVISLVSGIALALAMPGTTPQWKLVAGLILTLPAALVGGKLGEQHAQPSSPAFPAGPLGAPSGSTEA
jgi:MFS family permease